jgi:hypothetical protein
MSLVHKTVISVRSAVTGLDRPSLNAFASGEERIVSAYDEAVQESRDDSAVVEKLTRRKTQLLDMIASLKTRAA